MIIKIEFLDLSLRKGSSLRLEYDVISLRYPLSINYLISSRHGGIPVELYCAGSIFIPALEYHVILDFSLNIRGLSRLIRGQLLLIRDTIDCQIFDDSIIVLERQSVLVTSVVYIQIAVSDVNSATCGSSCKSSVIAYSVLCYCESVILVSESPVVSAH